MFRKILIANRGEIAVRVMRTARRMGIATVAVYSDADARAMHVAMADEAVHIGPSPAGESYLKASRIVEAARATGAEAIHPGYGFLSENPDFVQAVEKAGLVFIGPSASAIRAMGLKDAAKQLMEKAGVPVVPGYHGEAQELVVLATKAREIGYPVLITARAGGGGKGMRRVDHADDFPEALAAAKREAKAAFGDETGLKGLTYLRRFVEEGGMPLIDTLGASFEAYGAEPSPTQGDGATTGHADAGRGELVDDALAAEADIVERHTARAGADKEGVVHWRDVSRAQFQGLGVDILHET
jgi:acetyl/propionyl-CoA carboxylase alpha subunit